MWILDLGCTVHIVKRDDYFTGSERTIWKPAQVWNDNFVYATKQGNFNDKKVNIKNVYYVKGMSRNLLSCSTLTDRGLLVL